MLTGFKELLEGPPGSGKTYSIGTLVETGLEVFYFSIGNEMESLIGYFTEKNKPVPPNLHWHKLAASSAGLESLLKNAKLINSLQEDALYKITDSNKAKHDTFVRTLETLNNFVDQRTGETFGSVESWGVDRVLVIDPLTLLNDAAMSLIIGGKPTKSQSDWGRAQDQLENLIKLITQSVTCHVVICAHVEREVDQIFGGVKITTSLLGKALAGRFPSYFSDVILSQRIGNEWYWSTATQNVDSKARNLPWKDKLPPSFAQVYQTWKKREEASESIT